MDKLRVPRTWREIPQRYRLEGAKCLNCGAVYFPPRKVCNRCKSTNLEITPLPRRGKIVTYTVIRNPSPNYRIYMPYTVALIELENGVKITSQITDCEPEKLYIGMPVEAVLRRLYDDGEKGLIHYGYKFRPIAQI